LDPDHVASPETSTLSIDTLIDDRRVTVTRTASASREQSVLRIRFDYVLTRRDGEAEGSEFLEYHPILLLSRAKYAQAFLSAGLRVEYVEPGIAVGSADATCGLYIASKPE
jgi:hypothetical protein